MRINNILPLKLCCEFFCENVVTITLLKKLKKIKNFLIFSPFFIEKLISLTLAWPFGFDSGKVSFSFSKVYRTHHQISSSFLMVYPTHQT